MITIIRSSKGANPLSIPALNLNVEHGQVVEVEDQDLAIALVDQRLFEVVVKPADVLKIKKSGDKPSDDKTDDSGK